MESETNEKLIVLIESYFHRMGDLLEQSEKRIDQTNQMIKNLADTEHKLTETYALHLHNLVENRNEILLQNRELILHNKRLMDLVENFQKTDDTKSKQHSELLHIISSLTENKNHILKIDNKAQTI